MVQPDKNLVCARFRRALESYRAEASVQERMARELVERLAGKYYGRILEIGPGCGLLSDKIEASLEYGELELIDLDAECAKYHQSRRNSHFVAGDIETTELIGSYQLIISNAVLQWVGNLDAVLSKLHDALDENGEIAIGIFGQENCFEFRELTGNTLRYFSREEFLEKTSDRFRWDTIRTWKEQLNFASPIGVLQHLKATGATGLSENRKVWTKSRLDAFCDAYAKNFSNPGGGCHLTYHPVILTGRKLS